MPRNRTTIERAAGKLISAIQSEWLQEGGDPQGEASEDVLAIAHRILMAIKGGTIRDMVGGGKISDLFPTQWINAHPKVWPHIQVLTAVYLGEEVEDLPDIDDSWS